MHEFQCGHQECGSQFAASDKAALMRQVEEHLREVHNVEKATQTLLSYLESTCVTTRSVR
jgi:predicted small metal-binding protein